MKTQMELISTLSGKSSELLGLNFNRVLHISQHITAVARSKARTVFSRSNAGIVASNPTQGMDVCVRFFYVFVVLCVGNGLAKG
jgi:hypothetical protein